MNTQPVPTFPADSRFGVFAEKTADQAIQISTEMAGEEKAFRLSLASTIKLMDTHGQNEIWLLGLIADTDLDRTSIDILSQLDTIASNPKVGMQKRVSAMAVITQILVAFTD